MLFVVTLAVQLRSRRHNPCLHWTVILSTSMADTTMSGFMNRSAHAKYLSGGATSLGWGPQGTRDSDTPEARERRTAAPVAEPTEQQAVIPRAG